ncbi:MAG: hypothetical protein VX692_03840 [Chloroflexota bacterium]|nr:hypothetical protein [Chloroflexota bacterium]
MNKGWFILVAAFSLSLGLVTGGLIKGDIGITAVGFAIGIIIFLAQKRFK